MLPTNASFACRGLGKCALREYKGHTVCSVSGSCSLTDGADPEEVKFSVRTQFNPPPIPPREFDWSAVLDGYEGGDPIGYGKTEQEAIADLKGQLDERA